MGQILKARSKVQVDHQASIHLEDPIHDYLIYMQSFVKYFFTRNRRTLTNIFLKYCVIDYNSYGKICIHDWRGHS